MAGNFSDTTNIVDATQIDATDVKTPLDALDDALYDFSIGDNDFKQLRVADDGDKIITISSGAVTITNTYHKIENEAAAATDDLDTLNGGQAGDILILQPQSSSNVTTLKHNTGNLRLPHNLDYSLTGNNMIALQFTGTIWIPFSSAFGWKVPFFDVIKSSAQSITTAITTKVTWQTEISDVGSHFSLANDRFLPSIPGLYSFHGQVGYSSGFVDQMSLWIYIYKNGTEVKRKRVPQSGTNIIVLDISADIELNGSTDYVEIFTRHESGGGSANVDSSSARTRFSGKLIAGYSL